jgi:phenylalanyl-tRNA synthetase beta subunit
LHLDISATANRSDSLSIQGISTEIAALLNKPTKISNYSIKNLTGKNNFKNLDVKFQNESNQIVQHFSVIIENVN